MTNSMNCEHGVTIKCRDDGDGLITLFYPPCPTPFACVMKMKHAIGAKHTWVASFAESEKAYAQ